MAQIAPIVIADGAATPVNHTFNPVATSPEAVYRESLAGIALVGQGLVSMVNKSGSNAALQRIRIKLALPALETATGQNAAGYTAAPKVAYENLVVVDFVLPTRGTAAQRKDLRVLLSNLLKDAQVIDIVENLNVPY